MEIILSADSPIAIIGTNTVPTTTTLGVGKLAFGLIDGKVRFFGNNGSNILELTGKEYTALINGGITIDSTGQVSITTGGVTEAMLASVLQTKINNVLFKDNGVAYTPTLDYHPSTKKYVDDLFGDAMAVASGKTKALVFDTQEQLDDWLEGVYEYPTGLTASDLVTGDDLYVRDLDSLDYWWDGEQIQPLSAKTDLTNYYDKDEVDSFIAAISKSLTTAADQPVSIGGFMNAVTATINSSAVVSGGGLEVVEGAIQLKASDITVSLVTKTI